jgi:hypothetical protein
MARPAFALALHFGFASTSQCALQPGGSAGDSATRKPLRDGPQPRLYRSELLLFTCLANIMAALEALLPAILAIFQAYI